MHTQAKARVASKRQCQGGIRSARRRNRIDLPKALGAQEFFEFVSRGLSGWALSAVEAPIDPVTRLLVERRHPDDWERDVGRKSIAPVRRPCFVMQLRGHRWCLVLRSLAWVDARAQEAVREDASDLSYELGTQGVAFTGEQAARRIHYAIFEEGDLVEEAGWEGEELAWFRSARRERLKGPLGPRAVVDQLFRERGLYLPTCTLDSDGGQMWISLRDLPVSAVERADFLAL